MSQKIAILTGGTGGHVYPATGLAQQLKKQCPEADILFIVGGGFQTQRYFDKTLFPYQEIVCGTFSLKEPWQLIGAGFSILKGTKQSYAALKTFQPDIVVGFGSFHSFPAIVAAKMLSLPVIMYAADSMPGRVQRLMAPYVDLTAIHFPESAGILRGKCVEVGMPLRDGFRRSCMTKAEALAYFGLDPNMFTVLVFGGSQGARAINLLFLEAAKRADFPQGIQVIHLTGDEALHTQEAETVYAKGGIKACVKVYENRMDYAWSAADLFIARAGAATIAEAMEFEKPGILIPYPYAENHQDKNADFMAGTVGGAVKCVQRDLNAEKLCHEIKRGQQHLKQMGDAIRRYKERSRSDDLCSLVLRYTKDKQR